MNVYIHVPFCLKKCSYCAFYSQEDRSPELVKEYLQKLDKDLAKWSEHAAPAETLFIGGGTPNALGEKELEQFFSILSKNIAFTADAEISCECNPASLSKTKLTIIRSMVNRLSIGVQSFDAGKRQTLGRTGSDQAIYRAFELAANLKFDSVNCDLIYNIPGQSRSDFAEDLKIAKQLGINHLSCYSLTAEENAAITDWDTDGDLAEEMRELVEDDCFKRYEISNYAKNNRVCRHNINIWQGGLLYGFGPAAASFDGQNRFCQTSDLRQWLNEYPPITDIIPPEKRLREIFVFNLRTVKGWSSAVGKNKFGPFWNTLLHDCRTLTQKPEFAPLFDFQNGIALTPKGLSFWDSIAESLL